MYKVLQPFYDVKTLKPVAEGDVLDWTDADRIQRALDNGLIEEIKPEKKEEPKKAPAKKASKKK